MEEKNMKKNEVQKREKKSVRISIRTTEENSKFMSKNNLSPNAVFDKASKGRNRRR